MSARLVVLLGRALRPARLPVHARELPGDLRPRQDQRRVAHRRRRHADEPRDAALRPAGVQAEDVQGRRPPDHDAPDHHDHGGTVIDKHDIPIDVNDHIVNNVNPEHYDHLRPARDDDNNCPNDDCTAVYDSAAQFLDALDDSTTDDRCPYDHRCTDNGALHYWPAADCRIHHIGSVEHHVYTHDPAERAFHFPARRVDHDERDRDDDTADHDPADVDAPGDRQR